MKKITAKTRLTFLSLILISLLLISGCTSKQKISKNLSEYKNWQEVIDAGSNKDVTILMWGGNENINHYMDNFVKDKMKETYNITLKRVPMNAPDYLTKLTNEKKSKVNTGTGDVVWINAENFRTAKEGNLLDGPFTNLLPSLNTYYNQNDTDLYFDSGIPIEGYEAIWGRAQLVFSYDSAIIPDPPKSFAELKKWVKEHPGKFTYPKIPEDFVGTAFARTAFYELLNQKGPFPNNLTKDDFEQLSQPVIDYFNEIEPYLWREGTSYPGTQAQLDDLFKNGEVLMTMGFEVGKTPGLVASDVYPDTVKTYVFDTGTIGNSHYLGIPFNAPEKAAALLLIDFLQSPQAQIEKMDQNIWGDMPAFDPMLISPAQVQQLAEFDTVPGGIMLQELTQKRQPEMKAEYIDWIKLLWSEKVIN